MVKKKAETEKKYVLENMTREELQVLARSLESYEPLQVYRTVEEGAKAADLQKGILGILQDGS